MKTNDKARKCVTIFVIIMVTNIIYTLIEGIVIGSSSIYSSLLGSVLYLWLLFSFEMGRIDGQFGFALHRILLNPSQLNEYRSTIR